MSGERRTLDIQVFTENGTWRKPNGARTVEVLVRSADVGPANDDPPGESGYVIVVSYE